MKSGTFGVAEPLNFGNDAVDGWFGTPGFWKNWCEFIDGIDGNEPTEQAGKPGFPDGELSYYVDTSGDGIVNDGSNPNPAVPVDERGFLIGDLNRNGIKDGNEQTFFFSPAQMKDALEASNKEMQRDGIKIILRDLAATWANLLASEMVSAGDEDPFDHTDPADCVEPIDLVWWTVQWLEEMGWDAANYNDGPNPTVRTRSGDWKDEDVAGTPSPSAQDLHGWMDELNNNGYFNVDGLSSSFDEDWKGGVYGLDRDLIDDDDGVESFLTAFQAWEDAAV
jgi:hypothetical protein